MYKNEPEVLCALNRGETNNRKFFSAQKAKRLVCFTVHAGVRGHIFSENAR